MENNAPETASRGKWYNEKKKPEKSNQNNKERIQIMNQD